RARGRASGPADAGLLAAESERDVVVAAGREVGAALSRCAGGDELWLPALAFWPAAEELDRAGDDLDRLALGAVLGLPLPPVEPAVDGDGAALGEVLRAVLPLLVPDGDVEEVRLLGPLAAACVFLARIDGDSEAANGGAARRVAQLGVLRQVSDQDDAIDVGHSSLSSPLRRFFPVPNPASSNPLPVRARR